MRIASVLFVGALLVVGAFGFASADTADQPREAAASPASEVVAAPGAQLDEAGLSCESEPEASTEAAADVELEANMSFAAGTAPLGARWGYCATNMCSSCILGVKGPRSGCSGACLPYCP